MDKVDRADTTDIAAQDTPLHEQALEEEAFSDIFPEILPITVRMPTPLTLPALPGQAKRRGKLDTTTSPPDAEEIAPNYHATVHDIPADDRPRERLQRQGADMLTTSDLLAIILRTGTHRDNVIELSTNLLAKYGGLSGLMAADFYDLCATYGLGPAKTAQLKASLELGKRLSMVPAEKRYQITSADDAARLIRMEMMYLDHEELHIMLLDTRNQVIECIKRYKGTVNSSVLRIAEVLRPAITRNSPRIIICHNHPSGDPTPSNEDIDVTRQLAEAAKLLDIELLDHLIIGNPRYLSLKERLGW
ncbi:JAB domain-containing protein [Ktedonobacteria bacterium brp13]|nr:JAB domain-containing protein [Ktedonobacteria bacterium brp13]